MKGSIIKTFVRGKSSSCRPAARSRGRHRLLHRYDGACHGGLHHRGPGRRPLARLQADAIRALAVAVRCRGAHTESAVGSSVAGSRLHAGRCPTSRACESRDNAGGQGSPRPATRTRPSQLIHPAADHVLKRTNCGKSRPRSGEIPGRTAAFADDRLEIRPVHEAPSGAPPGTVNQPGTPRPRRRPRPLAPPG